MKSLIKLAVVGLALCGVVAVTGSADAQYRFTNRSRAAAQDYMRALEAQRQQWYQHNQMLNGYAHRLQQAQTLGTMAGVMRGGMASGGSIVTFGSSMGRGYVQDRGVQYGAQQFFNAPTVRGPNYRFWYGN